MTPPVMRALRVVFSCIALSMLPSAHASESTADSIARYTYEDGRIYGVRAGLGIATTLELDPEDPVLDYSTGFSSGWDIVRRDTLFYLKPKNVDVDTNLLIRTQKRSYIIELQVAAADWRKLDEARRSGVQYRVIFEYPAVETEAEDSPESASTAEAALSSMDVAPRLNFAYEVSTRTRRHWLVPSSVHDDGRFTYIRMPAPDNIPSGNWPSVFARNSRHEEDFVVNSNVEGDTIIVHGIYPFLVVRHGEEVVGLRRSDTE